MWLRMGPRGLPLSTNTAIGVAVQLLKDVNIFGGHANTLEKRVRGHFCQEHWKRLKDQQRLHPEFRETPSWARNLRATMQLLVGWHGEKLAAWWWLLAKRKGWMCLKMMAVECYISCPCSCRMRITPFYSVDTCLFFQISWQSCCDRRGMGLQLLSATCLLCHLHIVVFVAKET